MHTQRGNDISKQPTKDKLEIRITANTLVINTKVNNNKKSDRQAHKDKFIDIM